MPDTTSRPSKGLKGVAIQIGAETLIVPPLNFRQLQEYSKELLEFTKWGKFPNPYTEIPKSLPVILAAIRRNYPDYNEEELSDNIDMGNYREVFEAIMGVSGISKELLARGEALIKQGGESPVEAAKPRVM